MTEQYSDLDVTHWFVDSAFKVWGVALWLTPAATFEREVRVLCFLCYGLVSNIYYVWVKMHLLRYFLINTK